MTLTAAELCRVEQLVHELYPPFDGRQKVTREQMGVLLAGVRPLVHVGHAEAAARESFRVLGGGAVGKFIKRTIERAREMQGAAGAADRNRKPTGDDIARYWAAVKERKDRLYAPGLHDEPDAWACFVEMHAAGVEVDQAAYLTGQVYGPERGAAVAKVMGVKS